MAHRFDIRAPRFAVERGSSAPVDRDGLLVDFGADLPTGVVPASALESGPSFCLLGEPGLGKSTALEVLFAERLPIGEQLGLEHLHWVDLVEITSPQDFQEMVTEPIERWRSLVEASERGGTLTVVLDGVDESPIPSGAKGLAALLKRLFKSAGGSAIRYVLASRTADYPPIVHEVASSELSGYSTYELAPLRGVDVVRLASSRSVDGDRFFDAVLQRGCGPLAAVPLTLDFLIRGYARIGDLDDSPITLYQSALLELAGEHDEDRVAPSVGSAAERLEVASRLFAYLQLCGAGALWRGTDVGDMPNSDLDPFQLAGGDEELEGGRFRVTDEMIRSTLASGLFHARDSHRIGPAHASFSAYLGARYLHRSGLSEKQLRGLLTVATDSGSAGIPMNLRELAAWVVALGPDETEWLVEVEPVSLASNASVIASDRIRKLLVDRLLADPRDALRARWSSRWRLDHPGLAVQLREVFRSDRLGVEGDPAALRMELAIDIAFDSNVTDLLGDLLEIVEDVEVQPSIRETAANASASLDDEGCVDSFRRALDALNEGRFSDPNGVVRGLLLDLLWPDHISVDDLVRSMPKAAVTEVHGPYRRFRSEFWNDASDDQIPVILDWAIHQTDTHIEVGSMSGKEDHDLVEQLVDRAMSSENAVELIGPAVDLTIPEQLQHQDLRLPDAFDQRLAGGSEAPSARQLRRQFALVLMERSDDRRWHRMAWGWHPSSAGSSRYAAAQAEGVASPPPRSSLLDHDDFEWLLEKVAAYEAAGRDTSGYLPLLGWVFDTTDLEHIELAYATVGSPLWVAFDQRFRDVPIAGDEADSAREHLRLMRDHGEHTAGWEGVDEHAARLNALLNDAQEHVDAFWHLMRLLQVDPARGQWQRDFGDDLAKRRSVPLLEDGWERRVLTAACHYLATPPSESDYFDPQVTYWKIDAGYLALAWLARHGEPGNDLDSLSAEARRAWVGSVVIAQATPLNGPDRDMKMALLATLAPNALDLLPGLIDRYIRGCIAAGQSPREVLHFDAIYSNALATVYADHLADVVDRLREATLAAQADGSGTAATAPYWLRDTVTLLTSAVARHHHESGIDRAFAAIESFRDESVPGLVQAAGEIARALVAGSTDLWTRVLASVEPFPEALRELFGQLVHQGDAGRLTESLDEAHVGHLWDRLVECFPYSSHVHTVAGVAYSVSPDELARQWRDTVITSLANRGTPEALHELERAASEHPELVWLRDWVRTAETRVRENRWQPLTPGQLRRLLEDRGSRVVRSARDLADLVYEELESLSSNLLDEWLLLWDRRVDARLGEVYQPKSEPEFTTWVMAHLGERLENAGVIVNREAFVRQVSRSHLGLCVDIEAAVPQRENADRVLPSERCRIEIKANWSDDLFTAMRGQLVDDYLIQDQLSEGIFLIAWFDTEKWNDPTGTRGDTARRRDRTSAAAQLDVQALSAAEATGVRIQTLLLDVPRAPASNRRR